MFDSRKELLEKIQLGQDSYLELEEVRFSGPQVSGPSRDSIADELAAFANGHGGVYVMGVEDEPAKFRAFPPAACRRPRSGSAMPAGTPSNRPLRPRSTA